MTRKQLLDKYNKDAKIILGGHRVHKIIQFSDIAPPDYCVAKYVDYLLAGYTDFTAVKLLNKIKAKQEGKYAVISIADNGIGIAPKYFDEILLSSLEGFLF